MTIIKLFLITVASIVFILFAFSTKKRTFQKIFVLLGYLLLVVFIADPSYSDKVAQIFSIGTGKDLVLYIFAAITSLINIILYIKIKGQDGAITTIIREEAKKNAKKCKQQR